MIIYTDPETGHPYTVDPVTGRSEWVDPDVAGAGTQPLARTQELPVTPADRPPRRPSGRPVRRPVGSPAGSPTGSPARRPARRPARAGALPRPRGVPGGAGGHDRPGRRPGAGLLRAVGAIMVVMVLVVGAVLVLGSRRGGSQAAPSAGSGSRPPGIGSAVRDGKFEFRVTGRRTAKQLGNVVFNTRASGTYLLLPVTVRNISGQDKTFVSIAQKLYDTRGREYTADAKATAYLGQVKNLVDRIGPGGSVHGTIVFDVPDGAVPARVELHDSLLSDGVDVRLS